MSALTATEAAAQMTDAEMNRTLLDCALQIASAFGLFCIGGAALALLLIYGVEVMISRSGGSRR